MSELKDMRVVITGASSGFGSVAAKLLVDHGCKVTLGARREDRLKDLVKELGDLSVYEVTDVKKKEDLDSWYKNQLIASVVLMQSLIMLELCLCHSSQLEELMNGMK